MRRRNSGRRLRDLSLICFLGSALCVSAATAQVSVHCLSINLDRSVQMIGDDVAFVEFAEKASFNPFNGELAPSPLVRTNEVRGFYHFRFPGKELTDDFVLALPVGIDADADAVDDFFEPNLPLEFTTTNGTFEDPTGAGRIGAVAASWSRDAGADSGTCIMQFDTSLSLSIWTLKFRILSLSGTLDYSRNASEINGSIAFKDGSSQARNGKVRLKVQDADHALIEFGPSIFGYGVDVESSGPTLLQRIGSHYVSKIPLSDGNLATSFADYRQWVIRVTDLNDANANGIPDLTDVIVPARPVRLAIHRETDAWVLSIEGETGRSYEIQSSPTISPALWQKVQSLMLTNTSQTVTVPESTNFTTFWRVQVR